MADQINKRGNCFQTEDSCTSVSSCSFPFTFPVTCLTSLSWEWMLWRGEEKQVQTLNFKGKSSKLNPKGFHLVPDDPQVGRNQQGIDYDDEGKQNAEAVQQLVSFVLLCKCPNRLDKSSVFFSDVGGWEGICVSTFQIKVLYHLWLGGGQERRGWWPFGKRSSTSSPSEESHSPCCRR